VKRLLEYNFPDVSALSYDQLSSQLTVYPLGAIAIGGDERQKLKAGT
jgi:type III secretory pathway component EscV